MSEVATTNERATIGGNNPPPPDAIPNPKLAVLQKLLVEIETWQKITPTVTTAEEAAEVKAWLDKLRPALADAEEERKKNNAPHDRAIEANNKSYFIYTAKKDGKGKGSDGKAVATGLALKKAAQDFLDAEKARIEAESRATAERQRIADEEARKAREAAERLAEEGRLAEAAKATQAAEAAEITGAQAGFDLRHEPKKAVIAGGTGRVMTTRTTWHAEITDLDKARAHYGSYPEFVEAMNAAAREAILKLAGSDAISFKDEEMAPQGIRFFSRTSV